MAVKQLPDTIALEFDGARHTDIPNCEGCCSHLAPCTQVLPVRSLLRCHAATRTRHLESALHFVLFYFFKSSITLQIHTPKGVDAHIVMLLVVQETK